MTQRVIVAGGRDFGGTWNLGPDSPPYEPHWRLMVQALDDLLLDWRDSKYPGFGARDVRVLSGMARGADTLALEWCVINWVPWDEYPADWDKHGKAAGLVRNIEMAQNADTLIAFWDGYSKGTKHMIAAALNHGLEVHIYHYKAAPHG